MPKNFTKTVAIAIFTSFALALSACTSTENSGGKSTPAPTASSPESTASKTPEVSAQQKELETKFEQWKKVVAEREQKSTLDNVKEALTNGRPNLDQQDLVEGYNIDLDYLQKTWDVTAPLSKAEFFSRGSGRLALRQVQYFVYGKPLPPLSKEFGRDPKIELISPTEMKVSYEWSRDPDMYEDTNPGVTSTEGTIKLNPNGKVELSGTFLGFKDINKLNEELAKLPAVPLPPSLLLAEATDVSPDFKAKLESAAKRRGEKAAQFKHEQDEIFKAAQSEAEAAKKAQEERDAAEKKLKEEAEKAKEAQNKNNGADGLKLPEILTPVASKIKWKTPLGVKECAGFKLALPQATCRVYAGNFKVNSNDESDSGNVVCSYPKWEQTGAAGIGPRGYNGIILAFTDQQKPAELTGSDWENTCSNYTNTTLGHHEAIQFGHLACYHGKKNLFCWDVRTGHGYKAGDEKLKKF
ncbi:hypothetical protein BK816_08300 [Boudabousia tangfeifanii]|uniref:SCP domain-containing protein n=1 Tax=Boudabousia tangfeifanii TaxID=1912795 RepID=A0A1D9MMB1_9ACTO|nr:hypothetical protein [Boudabousia tangfeifanii]AOZ73280.1 hypothetical protein BK816_08300 [Boudabousia tangfeifanii]